MNFFKEEAPKILAKDFKAMLDKAIREAEKDGIKADLKNDDQARNVVFNLLFCKLISSLCEQVMGREYVVRFTDFYELTKLYQDVIEECKLVHDEKLKELSK